MASDSVRWRNIREFLDDLPKEHCRVKPDHDFCTVCLRINYLIAQDCPLFHLRPKKKKRPATPAPPEARPEPIKDHLSSDDVKQALKGEDFPIIEFAGPRGTGGHKDDEEIFEVKPIDVEPVKAPPPDALKKPPRKIAKDDAGGDDVVADAKPATAVVDRDPESIVQEIMEELEFPETEEVEEETKPSDVPPEDEGDEVEETEGPPVVKKEAVRKRRPKGE